MKVIKSVFLNKNTAIITLICAWLFVQLTLLFHRGIFIELEAGKYIEQAKLFLKTGNVSAPNLWFYSTQILLLALSLKLQAGFISVYLVQLFFNALSTFTFYKICKSFSDKKTSCIATILLIFNLPLQEFNNYLQTESLFISLLILFTNFVLRIKELDLTRIIQLICFLILITLTRPTGMMLIPSTFIYLFFRFYKLYSWSFTIAITLIIGAFFFLLLNTALGSGGEWRFMLSFRKELVLCTSTPYDVDIKISDNPNSIEGFWYYITHNFHQFIRLSLLKTVAFWGLCRSYFSHLHNLYLIMYIYPVYIFALLSLRTWVKKDPYSLLFFILNIALAWLTVILTCDDWHNRFFLVIMPFLYFISLPALQSLFRKKDFQYFDE